MDDIAMNAIANSQSSDATLIGAIAFALLATAAYIIYDFWKNRRKKDGKTVSDS